MKTQLNILNEGRTTRAAFIFCALLGQALALGLAAIATRDAFVALRDGGGGLSTPIMLLILAGVGGAALQFLARVEAERLGYDFARSLRSSLYQQYARMPMSEISRRKLGSLSLRFVGDLTAARGWAGTGMTRSAAALITLPVATVCLWYLNPLLAMVAAPPVLVALALAVVIGWKQEQRHRGLRKQRARIASSMMERVAMAPHLDLMGRTPKEVLSLEASNAKLETLAVRRIRPSTLMRLFPDIGVAIAGALMFLAAARSDVDAADVAGALAALAILARPLRDLGGAWDKFCAWSVAREKCEVILSAPIMERRRNTQSKVAALMIEDLVVRNAPAISFETGYQGVHHLNLPVDAALIDVIAGLDDPDKGRVRYLNRNGGARRPRVSLVTSSSPILSGSLRRALTLGAIKRPTDEWIETMAQTYGFGPALDRLGGLDGRLGENGEGLTLDEAFRLLIVRAALTSPNVVLVDAKLLVGEADRRDLITQFSDNTSATVLVLGGCDTNPHWTDVIVRSDDHELEIRRA